MKRALPWLALRTTVIGLLLLGYLGHITGAQNLALFLVWVLALLSPLALHDTIQESWRINGPSVTRRLRIAVDIGIVLLLIWFGAQVTAVAWLVAAVVTDAARRRASNGSTASHTTTPGDHP